MGVAVGDVVMWMGVGVVGQVGLVRGFGAFLWCGWVSIFPSFHHGLKGFLYRHFQFRNQFENQHHSALM